MPKTLIITLIIICFLPATGYGGAAFGNKADYAHSWPTVNYESDKTVAVGVHDQRPYVVDQGKLPTYVGTMRGGFYNPFDIETQSGKPLADDVTVSVVSGFNTAGIIAKPVKIDFSCTHEQAMQKLLQAKSDCLILITLNEWRSDTYKQAGFFINAEVIIYDQKGKEIARSSTSHKDIGSRDGTVKSPEDAAKIHLNRLLNTPPVKTALQ